MKYDRDALKLIGFFAAVFGVMVLVGNPINFVEFPRNVSAFAWFGIALLLGGLVAFWYGSK
ncbi:MAG: hypothetical protein WC602_04670 [archaeon]